jgi:hypothetical protein
VSVSTVDDAAPRKVASVAPTEPRTVPSVAPRPGRFTEQQLAGLPEPVGRYLAAAIAPELPVDRTLRIDVRGRLRHRVWLPFRARYQLTPTRELSGVGTLAEVVVGVEHAVGGGTSRQLRLGGILPVRGSPSSAAARDVAARAALGALFVPTALLPRAGVEWSLDGPGWITATIASGDQTATLRLRIDADGRLLAAEVDRWGDPLRTGRRRRHTFRAVPTAERTFSGLTVPSRGRAGWVLDGTPWPAGEVLRYEITALRPATVAGGASTV